MKNTGKPKKSMSLFLKITLANIFIVAAVVIIIALIIFSSFANLTLEKEMLLGKEAVEKIQTFVTDKYDRAYNLSNFMHHSSNVAEYFSTILARPNEAYNHETVRFLDNYLLSVGVDPAISEYILVTNHNNVYTTLSKSGRDVIPSFDFFDYPPVQKALASEKSMYIYYDDQTPYISKNTEPVISFVGVLYNPALFPKKQVVGIYIMNVPLDQLDQLISEFSVPLKGDITLTNLDHEVLYSTIPSIAGNQLSSNTIANQQNEVMHEKKIGLSGMDVINTVTREALFEDIRSLQFKMILVLVISIASVTVAMFFILRIYNNRIVQIAELMQNISGSDFSARIPVTSTDEIGMLANSFNEMSEQIDKYIKLNYSAEMNLRVAELNSLQAQINPHFLYNTIESIRMKAITVENHDVADMLFMLGNIFRWSIRYQEKIVSLEDELDYVSSYLELQSLRFEDPIDIDIQVGEDLLDNGIPKLILQPVVENAITHGLFTVSKHPAITIGAVDKGDKLLLFVEDNGIGMTDEELRTLQDKVRAPTDASDENIGLKNVHERIRLLFGDDYGVSIASTYKRGTTVSLLIPNLGKESMREIV